MFYYPDQLDSDGMQLFLVASQPEGQGSNFVQRPYTPSRDLIKVSFRFIDPTIPRCAGPFLNLLIKTDS